MSADAGRPVASTRDRIRDAAGGLFAARGFGGVSIREIAAAAGVAPSALYGHYRSKEEILVAVVDHAHEATAAMMRGAVLELGGESALVQLAELTRRMTNHWLADPSRMRVMLVEMERLPRARSGAARALRDDALQTFVEVVARGQERGEIVSGVDPTLLTWTIRGIADQLAMSPSLRNVAGVADAMAAFATRMASPRLSPQRPGVADLPTVEAATARTTPERILAVASELFADRGFEAVPVRDIAAAVGIRAPSIYAHFESKDHLRFAILERVGRRRRELLDAAISRQPADAWAAKVEAAVRVLAAASLADTAGVVVTNDQFDRLPEERSAQIEALYRGIAQRFDEIVDGGRRDGVFRYAEPAPIVARSLAKLGIQLAWRRRFVHDNDPAVIGDAHADFALRIVDYSG